MSGEDAEEIKRVLDYLLPVPDAQGSSMTNEAKLAMLEGRLALTKEDDYGIHLETRKAPEGRIHAQFWLVRSRDGMKVTKLGAATVRPGETLSLLNIHRAFEVRIDGRPLAPATTLKFEAGALFEDDGDAPRAWIGPEGQLMLHEIYEAWSKRYPEQANEYEPLR